MFLFYRPVPSRPSPLSLPLHPSWPPLLPHRCRPINLRHRLFNSLPLLMIRHADCRPLLAASTAASNASYPPFKTGVNKINNVRFQPPSPLPPSSPPSSTASAYLSPPRRLHCCDVRQTTRTTDDNVGTVNTVSIIIIVVVIGYLDDDDDDDVRHGRRSAEEAHPSERKQSRQGERPDGEGRRCVEEVSSRRHKQDGQWTTGVLSAAC